MVESARRARVHPASAPPSAPPIPTMRFTHPRRPIPRIFLPLLAAAALAASAAPAAAQGSVSGRVVDAATGQPVVGAGIQIGAQTRALTDAEGRFTLRLAPGTHAATVARIGYQRQPQTWTVGGEPLEVTVRLRPEAVEVADLRVRVARGFEEARNRMLNAVPAPTRVYREEDFERTVSPNAADFVRMHGRIARAPCPNGNPSPDCVRKYGRVRPLAVYIDDRPAMGGMREVESVPIDQIARVEIIDGSTVRVYTRFFLEDAIRRGLIAIPERI